MSDNEILSREAESAIEGAIFTNGGRDRVMKYLAALCAGIAQLEAQIQEFKGGLDCPHANVRVAIALAGQKSQRILDLEIERDSLRKERDAAQEQFDQLKIEIINASQCVGYYGDDTDSAITCLTSAIAQAEPRMLKAEEERDAAIEAGKADKARLDWLEKVGFSTVRNGRGDGPKTDPGVHSWREITTGVWRWTAAWISSEYRNSRAAIDAAMLADQEGTNAE